MPSSNNIEIISHASPHTIKKFELVEKYIKSWSQKLMQTSFCNGIIFIDCMCNSGVYKNDDGETVFGTSIRVANVLRDVAGTYPNKQVVLYFNDISEEKVIELKRHLPLGPKSNFVINTSIGDGNELLKKIGPQLTADSKFHFFLFYDPYDAHIDWNALAPFFRNWGEVLINHMISDPIRGISQAKSEYAKQKYQETYMFENIESLLPFGSDKNAYKKRLEYIISNLKGSEYRKYYIASYPFFNRNNAFVYDLVHCTSNIAGFDLYKNTAWSVFEGHSSLKDRHGQENQMVLDFDNGPTIKNNVDEYCYNIYDIADYLQNKFTTKSDVPLADVWETLKTHPIFPSKYHRTEIKNILKNTYGAEIHRSTISFS